MAGAVTSGALAQGAGPKSVTADAAWQPAARLSGVAARQGDLLPRLADYQHFRLNLRVLQGQLAFAPSDAMGAPIGDASIVRLPMPDGTLQRFRVVDSPILSPELQPMEPTVRTFRGQGVDDPTATVRFGWTINGFHATILREGVSVWIDPMVRGDQDDVVVYAKNNIEPLPQSFRCAVVDDHHEKEPGSGDQFSIQNQVGGTLRTYRLALNGTIEYTNFFGSVAIAEADMIVAINRVSGVYERDLSARLNIVYKKAWSGSDSFSNFDGVALLGQNQTNLDSVVGDANYDIGHIFSTGGGGVASLRSLGRTGLKARGVTGLPSPVGDPFYIDYVAHEMGHQFGGNHTFNGTTDNCGGGNRASTAAYEPGSGSTIMAYAGICGAENVQNVSDAYFHAKSFDEIVNHMLSIPTAGTLTTNGNNIPAVNAGADFAIPQSTPFRLVGSATDVDGDALTYCWEQYNLGTASPTATNTTRPLFRTFSPTSSTARVLPRLTDILSGAATPWEILPAVDRSMTFRLTTRDNRAGGGAVQDDDMVITVAGAAFSVTSPNTAVTWNAGTTQTVTWAVGGVAPNPASVNIFLSTTGGTDFFGAGPILLASAVPNDGSQTVTVPWVRSTTARILVQPTTSIYFDVSNVNFSISENASTTLTMVTPSVFGSQNATGRITLSNPAPAGGLIFALSDNSASVNTPSSVTVLAGGTTADFTMTTSTVASTTSASINAFRPGWLLAERRIAPLTLNPIPTPLVGNDSYTATEDTTLTVVAPGVLGNDTTGFGTLTVTALTNPTKGVLTLTANGSFTYVPGVNQTGADSFTYRATNGSKTADGTVNLTITAVDEVIQGAVTLESFGGNRTTIPVVIEVRNPGSTLAVRTFNATLNSSGGFTIPYATPITPGTYDISAKASHWLRQTLTNQTITKFGALSLKFTLINGDIDGDNAITVFDYDLLSQAFDSVAGDATWNAMADLDGDGAVTVFDYDILSTNFDLTGNP